MRVFISYKREGVSEANLLYEHLTSDGYEVFFDYSSMRSGRFDEQLYKGIEECDAFLLVLTKGSLDCSGKEGEEKNWVYREVEYALKYKKHIVLALAKNFDFPDSLPDTINEIRYVNGASINYEYKAAFFQKIEELIHDKKYKHIPASLVNNLSPYYEKQVREFEKEYDEASFLGKEALSTSYIDPFTQNRQEKIPMLQLVEKWFEQAPHGVLLLHGEPGHGKSTFCMKCVYEYYKERAFQSSRGVLQFSLNPAKNPKNTEIIYRGKLSIEDIFYDINRPSRKLLELKDAKRMMIFLDGYDEIRMEIQNHTTYKSYIDFRQYLEELAKDYGIHFVVTSRTNAIENIKSQSDCYRFLPLEFEEQNRWCCEEIRPKQYRDYWNHNLKKICEKEHSNMESMEGQFVELLKIPFIFRMVMAQQYQFYADMANKAQLYEDLFIKTMIRHWPEEVCKRLNDDYQELAYDIWCNNEDVTERTGELKELLLFSYYIKENSGSKVKEIGFIHRSCYQYYLALYFYHQMQKCTKDGAEDLLKKLAERRIDPDILDYFMQIAGNKREETLNNTARMLLDSLDETEALLITKKKCADGTAEEVSFRRCNNIFVNTINLCLVFDIASHFNSKQKIITLLKWFSVDEIQLVARNFGEMIDINDSRKERINLREVNLEGANLERADLRGINLREANLEGANLREANLSQANLIRSNLIGSNLERTDLSKANLERAHLTRANLERVNLQNTNLTRANLTEANLKKASLMEATLIGANLQKSRLERSNLNKANLMLGNLTEANLRKVHLTRANLERANLTGANLEKANLKETHLENANLKKTNLTGANLKWTYLTGANLFGSNLEGAILLKSNLAKTNLNWINLMMANLTDASLEGAILIGANLGAVNLERASLEKCNLEGANLAGANLRGSNLSKCNLRGANFKAISLYGTFLRIKILEGTTLTKGSLDQAIIDDSVDLSKVIWIEE